MKTNQPTNKTRIILMGGSSHVGKSTLSRTLATKLDWNYLATDSLARHPGRPWIGANGRTVREHVVKHYRTLNTESLLIDVLLHYEANVMPQVKTLVCSYQSNLSTKGIIIEGSALWPKFTTDLIKEEVRGIWLTASDRLLQNRILSQSNFHHVSQNEKHPIEKFLDRTLLYNRRMREEVNRLGFDSINVESTTTIAELVNHCLKLI